MSEDVDVDYMMVLQREVSDLRVKNEQLRAAMEKAVAEIIHIKGPSDDRALKGMVDAQGG